MIFTKTSDVFPFYVGWGREKTTLNPIWPVRLKRISRNVISNLIVARNRFAQIWFHVVHCRSDYLNMIGFQSDLHKYQIWADSLDEAKALYIEGGGGGGGGSPQPPPMCIIQLDDMTAAILRQNAHHTPAYWWRGDRVMKPICVWGWLEGHGGQIQWGNMARILGLQPYSFSKDIVGFLMTTESQDLGLTSHPKDGAFYSIVSPSLYWGVRTHTPCWPL